jgi:hypothetical protein
LGAFVHAAVQAVPLPKKADFYASAAQAQQSPYLSAACFSVLLFPLFTVLRLFAAVCIFSRKRPKAAYPKYAVLGRSFKKFALLRQQYRQKQYRSYIFLPRERNGTVIKLRSHFTSS